MTIKKLIIIISIVTVVAMSGVVIVALNPNLLTGLTSTISGTVKDTGAVVGVGNEPEPSTTPVVVPPVEVSQTDPTPTEQPVVVMPTPDTVRKEDNLKVYIPNTAGDFAVVVSGKDALVINGGYGSDSKAIKTYLAQLGITKARYAVATNYLSSSVEGFPKLLSYLPADYILVAENVASKELDKKVVEYLDKNQMIWSTPHDASSFKLGKAKFELVKTHDKGSIIVSIENGDSHIVLSGSTTKIEQGAIDKLPSDIDLYVVTASNKDYSVREEMLEKLNPKNLVVNDAKNVGIAGVTSKTENKELVLFRSTQCGNIVVGSNGEDAQVSCAKK